MMKWLKQQPEWENKTPRVTLFSWDHQISLATLTDDVRAYCETIGVELTDAVVYSLSASTVVVETLWVKDVNPDVVYFWGAPTQLAMALRDAYATGLLPEGPQWVAPFINQSRTLSTMVGEKADGVISQSGGHGVVGRQCCGGR